MGSCMSTTVPAMGRVLAVLLVIGCQAGGTAKQVNSAGVSPARSNDAREVGKKTPIRAARTAGGAPRGDAAAAKADFFPRRRGWSAVDSEAATRIAGFAADYASYLAAAKTPRGAVAGLVAMFREGAAELKPGDRPTLASGGRFWFVNTGGDAAAFVVLGKEPLERGARIIVASIDSARIELKQKPVYTRAGFAMLDTVLHGDIDMKSWLSRPMALHVHVYRPGAPIRGLDVIVGEAADDPVLSIPDLLPHLSGRVQRKRIVDSPERMDAIAAASRRALSEFLAARGMDERTFAQAESLLVPAGPPEFVGVDRALLAGYGHGHRALAYAALRALIATKTPRRSAVVIVIGRLHRGTGGISGIPFIKNSLSRLLYSLSGQGPGLDILETRRFYARSHALVSGAVSGVLDSGLSLNPLSDDALPQAVRRVIDAMDRAGVMYQLGKRRHRSISRELGILGVEAVDIALPLTGQRAPMQLLSTLDLYQAKLAADVWFAP